MGKVQRQRHCTATSPHGERAPMGAHDERHMDRESHNHMKHTSGQSIIEFAVIAPLLIIMLLGTVDFALAFSNQMALRSAVAEGGYFIAQHPGREAIAEQRIRERLELPGAAEPGRLIVTFTTSSCMSGRQDTTVEAIYRHEFWFSSVLPSAHVTLRSGTTVPQFGSCS